MPTSPVFWVGLAAFLGGAITFSPTGVIVGVALMFIGIFTEQPKPRSIFPMKEEIDLPHLRNKVMMADQIFTKMEREFICHFLESAQHLIPKIDATPTVMVPDNQEGFDMASGWWPQVKKRWFS